MTREQRELLADTLKDLANIAAGAMFFGEFLSDGGFSLTVVVSGVLLWTALVTVAVRLSRWMIE